MGFKKVTEYFRILKTRNESKCQSQKRRRPLYHDLLLLTGDLHCHSCHSQDGVFTVDKIAAYCVAAGMDFAAITDHNSIGALSEEKDRRDGFIFIPGSECSLDESCGHFNVLGINDIEISPNMLKKEEIVEYMERMRARGALIQLNHPFAGTLGWHVGWDIPFDMVEIWNRVYSPKNQRAIDWWHEQLRQGRRIPATGGTDSHTTKSERFPINCVYAAERTADSILDAVKKGHSFISECTYGPWIQMKIGEGIMGDVVRVAPGALLEIFVEQMEIGSYVVVYSDQGEELRQTPEHAYFGTSLPVIQGRLFYRIEVWRGRKISAISNPIYCQW